MSNPRTENHHDDNIKRVAKSADDIEKKFMKQKGLKQWMDQGKVLLSMIRDYIGGRYREVPYWAIGAISLALLYVLNPLDVIPDIVPGLGYLDDATVIAFCLKLVEKEIEKYKEWLASKKKTTRDKPGPIIDVEI
jgi:uncharacterized membrane protein YkvA (DUF1232 family)